MSSWLSEERQKILHSPGRSPHSPHPGTRSLAPPVSPSVTPWPGKIEPSRVTRRTISSSRVESAARQVFAAHHLKADPVQGRPQPLAAPHSQTYQFDRVMAVRAAVMPTIAPRAACRGPHICNAKAAANRSASCRHRQAISDPCLLRSVIFMPLTRHAVTHPKTRHQTMELDERAEKDSHADAHECPPTHEISFKRLQSTDKT